MTRVPLIFRKIGSHTWTPDLLSLMGGILYLAQSLAYAFKRTSVLDEGAYLYKGLLFVTGQYVPFQDYGPWTNHMPLSFVIPGFIQWVFGPGLRTGRYFAVLLGVLMLLGLWKISRELGGRWWAAGAVWTIALNPFVIATYSVAVSQGLVACMLIWVMVLVLGEQRSIWQLAAGSSLAGLLLMTRINMAPVLPLALIYIFWQHGKRAGLISAASGILIAGTVHLFYWPGILRLWSHWLPASITPFLDMWRLTDLAIPSWNPSIAAGGRWFSFLFGLRANFIPLFGLIAFSIMILGTKGWRSRFHRNAAAFTSVLLLVLTLAHVWAALGKNYCVYCFAGYLTFFSGLGLLLIIITLIGWQPNRNLNLSWLVGGIILLLAALIGYGSYQAIGPSLLELPLPRLKQGQIQSGTAPLWGVLEGLFSLSYQTSRWLVPTIAGAVCGIILLVVVWIVVGKTPDRQARKPNIALYWVYATLAAGLLLAPTSVLAGDQQSEGCSYDVIETYESVGEHLAQYIPAGARIYWQGSLSVVPLLYLPELALYPAQINDGYSFYIGGDADELRRFGFWNSDLREKWRDEAEFILLIEDVYDTEWKHFLESGNFVELERSPATDACMAKSRLRLFRRSIGG